MGLDLVLDQVVGVLADQHRIVFGDEFFGDDYDLVGHEGLSQVGRDTGVLPLPRLRGSAAAVSISTGISLTRLVA